LRENEERIVMKSGVYFHLRSVVARQRTVADQANLDLFHRPRHVAPALPRSPLARERIASPRLGLDHG
jgi:hypothetical protein